MNPFSNKEDYVQVATFLGEQNARKGFGWEIGKLKPTPSELYVQGVITAGGTQDLLGGSTVQEKGVTNFDGNRLQKGRIFAISDVTVQYGTANGGTKPYNVSYGDELPAQLENATLVVRQKNEVIVKLPISAIQNAKKSDNYYRALGAFALIEPEHQVEMSIEFPSGTSIKTEGDKKSYIRVLLKGFETYSKR